MTLRWMTEKTISLVQPGSMHGQVDEAGIRPCRSHPVDRSLPVVRRAVVDNPVDASGARIGLEGHNALDELHKRHDPGLLGDGAERDVVEDARVQVENPSCFRT